VAQRLARRLCDKCKVQRELTDGERESLAWAGLDHEMEAAWQAVGCGACGRTGFYGRFAIHEVLNVTEPLERLIAKRGHAEDIKRAAIEDGMITLRQSGLSMVEAGLTSIEEILRVVA
jgi:type IV pilus assembly protein PilB